MAAAKIGQVTLKNVRLSYPHIWKPQASVENGKLQYSANFLIDPKTAEGKANIKACEAAVAAVKKAEWIDKGKKVPPIETKRLTFRDGDTFTNEEGDVYEHYSGMMVAKGSNMKKFPIVNRDKTPLDESENVIYAGCYVDAVLRFYAVSGKEKGGAGVFASLEAIRFRRDGEAFGAGPVDVDDVFDDLDDEEEAEQVEDELV